MGERGRDETKNDLTMLRAAIAAPTTRLRADGYAAVLTTGVCVRCALRFSNVQDAAVYA
jgi:hypothetical protein